MSALPPCLLAIDLGTSGVKAMLLDPQTGRTQTQRRAYPTVCPHPGWAQQDPRLWWKAACEAVRALLQSARISPAQIAAVGVDGMSWTPVCLNATGEALCDAPLWYDTRAQAENERIKSALGGAQAPFDNPVQPYYTLPKLLWLLSHDKDMRARLARVLSSNGYIVYRLTGEMTHDHSQAYGWPFYDMRLGAWDFALAEALGAQASWLPPLCESACVAGRVTRAAAAMCGLNPGTPVVAGGLDAACGALGAGVIAPGDVHEQSGSAGGLSVCMEACQPADGMILSRHVVPGKWLVQGGTVGGGGLTRWLQSAAGGADLQTETGLEALMREAAQTEPGADGLLFLPYMAGERSPIWNARAKGVLFGLDYTKTRGHIARAVLEGAAFALRHNIEASGADFSLMRAVGGAAENALWMQIKADITGKSICAVRGGEATALGCAALAGVACGAYPDFESACALLTHLNAPYRPNAALKNVYDASYARYLELYARLQDMMR